MFRQPAEPLTDQEVLQYMMCQWLTLSTVLMHILPVISSVHTGIQNVEMSVPVL